MIVDTHSLCLVALSEYPDVVADAMVPDLNRLRVFLVDGTQLSVWFSLKLKDRFSFHWDRTPKGQGIFRVDNAPHARWRDVSSFPLHCHPGSEDGATEVDFPSDPVESLRWMLGHIRSTIDET